MKNENLEPPIRIRFFKLKLIRPLNFNIMKHFMFTFLAVITGFTVTVNSLAQTDSTQRYGCTDPAAINFNPNASYDDGSCVYDSLPPSDSIPGCMRPLALNFNPEATAPRGCIFARPEHTICVRRPAYNSTIIDTLVSTLQNNCKIDYSGQIDSVSLGNFNRSALNKLAVEWLIWQNGKASKIISDYKVNGKASFVLCQSILCAENTENIRLKSGQDMDKAITFYAVVSLTSVTGVPDHTLTDENVNVFPNPTRNEITLWFESAAAKEYRIDIYAVDGQRLISKIMPSHEGENSLLIDLTDLKRGLYFLRIIDGSQMLYTTKVLKE